MTNNIYPPYEYLTKVLEHCPKAGSTYLKLWKFRDSENKLKFSKEQIRTKFNTSFAKFRHDLWLLVNESIIELYESKDISRFKITLLDSPKLDQET